MRTETIDSVINSATDYEQRQETIALLKLLALSAQDKIKGRVNTDADFIAHIENLRQV
jgi:hypothetical protein